MSHVVYYTLLSSHDPQRLQYAGSVGHVNKFNRESRRLEMLHIQNLLYNRFHVFMPSGFINWLFDAFNQINSTFKGLPERGGVVWKHNVKLELKARCFYFVEGVKKGMVRDRFLTFLPMVPFEKSG